MGKKQIKGHTIRSLVEVVDLIFQAQKQCLERVEDATENYQMGIHNTTSYLGLIQGLTEEWNIYSKELCKEQGENYEAVRAILVYNELKKL